MYSINRKLLFFYVLFFINGLIAYSQKTADLIQQINPAQPLYELHEMDMHLHAGMECPVDLDTWINLAVQDGRKVLLLLDHLELYRKTQSEYEVWAKEHGFPATHRVGSTGHKELMNAFDAARKRKDVLIFKGWEISEGELDEKLEEEPMRQADVLGWHISPNNGKKPPDGQSLIKRAQQLKALQAQFPVPMILFHPFPMRLENIQNTAQRQGVKREVLKVSDYRFFQPGEQQKLAEILRGTSIYIEISRATESYWNDPVCREALIADIQPLAEAGVQFTVSTDNHSLESANRPFRPELYCKELGVTPRNSNSIIQDLLSQQKKPN